MKFLLMRRSNPRGHKVPTSKIIVDERLNAEIINKSWKLGTCVQVLGLFLLFLFEIKEKGKRRPRTTTTHRNQKNLFRGWWWVNSIPWNLLAVEDEVQQPGEDSMGRRVHH